MKSAGSLSGRQLLYTTLWLLASIVCPFDMHDGRKTKTTRTHGPLYSSSIRPSQQDSLLYTQFSRTHPSSISSSIHSINCETHLSLYLNISMSDLVLKDLLRRI
jgi:hypothetical protein